MKNIILSGSSGFIGSYLLKKLRELDYNIIELDINNLKNAVNCTNEKEVFIFFENLKKKYERIDVLINCIGIPDNINKLSYKELEDIPVSSFRDYININLNSIFIIIQNFIKFYKNSCNIINFTSLYSVISPNPELYNGLIKHPGYIASKFGVLGLSKYLGVLLSKYNIKVSCIAPGCVYKKSLDKEF